jgi:hypothetical protein
MTQTAEARLKTFIEKFAPANRTLLRSVRRALRKIFPTAYEMVYDNYNFFVIGYSPTERPSDAILSMAGGPNGVSICFMWGAKLSDPKKLLSGGGNQTRFLRLEGAHTLAKPDVRALIKAAVAQSRAKFRAKGKVELIIKSVSAKQRPRRKP